jgi:hypothetical protein
VLDVSGGGVRLMRFPHNDCLGMRKREMVANDNSACVLETEDEADGSKFVKTESSGTWWTILGPDERF